MGEQETNRWASVLPIGSQVTATELVAIAITYFSVGLASAVVIVNAGTDRWIVVLSAVVINAVTTQLAYLAVVEAGGSTLSAVLSGWLVATRFGLLAAALGPRLWPRGWRRMLAAYSTFDPNAAMAMREADDSQCRRVFVVTSMFLVPPWFIGTAVGAVAGDYLGNPSQLGLDAALPAMLLAIIWPQLKKRSGRIVAGTAAVIALGLVEVAPGGVPAVAAVLAAALVLVPWVDR